MRQLEDTETTDMFASKEHQKAAWEYFKAQSKLNIAGIRLKQLRELLEERSAQYIELTHERDRLLAIKQEMESDSTRDNSSCNHVP
jgi:hypothetical protein